MTLESLLHPYSLIFLIAFALSMTGPHWAGRRKMMTFKFMGDTLFATYLFLIGGHAGACGALIAGTGALIQALTPIHHLKKTIWLRIGLAIALSVISIFVSYNQLTDLLPILMVIMCRFGELQSQSQRIRMVYFASCLPWIVYHAINGFYLPMGSTILIAASLLISIIRHHHATVKSSAIKEA